MLCLSSMLIHIHTRYDSYLTTRYVYRWLHTRAVESIFLFIRIPVSCYLHFVHFLANSNGNANICNYFCGFLCSSSLSFCSVFPFVWAARNFSCSNSLCAVFMCAYFYDVRHFCIECGAHACMHCAHAKVLTIQSKSETDIMQSTRVVRFSQCNKSESCVWMKHVYF